VTPLGVLLEAVFSGSGQGGCVQHAAFCLHSLRDVLVVLANADVARCWRCIAGAGLPVFPCAYPPAWTAPHTARSVRLHAGCVAQAWGMWPRMEVCSVCHVSRKLSHTIVVQLKGSL